MATMKQRLRRANQERLAEKHLGASPQDSSVTTEDDSSSTSASSPSGRNTPEKTKKAASSPQFPRTFSLDFPDDPFQTMPETPSRQTPQREPVWKKRLRHNQRISISSSPNGSPAKVVEDLSPSKLSNTSPAASPFIPHNVTPTASPFKPRYITPNSSPSHPGLPPKPSPNRDTESESSVSTSSKGQENERLVEKCQASDVLDQTLSTIEALEKQEQEEEERSKQKAEASSGTPPQGDEEKRTSQNPKLSKNVSFDEAGLIASGKGARLTRRKKEKTLEGFEDQEDRLSGTDSSHGSDLFTNLFDDDDFSLGTPTIYTDGTDDNSTLSSYTSRRKSRDRRNKEAFKKRRSRSRGRREDDDNSEYDFDFVPSGCRVLEEFKMFSELFGKTNACSGCAKIEDKPSSRGRRGRRSTRSRRSRRSRSEG